MAWHAESDPLNQNMVKKIVKSNIVLQEIISAVTSMESINGNSLWETQ